MPPPFFGSNMSFVDWDLAPSYPHLRVGSRNTSLEVDVAKRMEKHIMATIKKKNQNAKDGLDIS